MDRPELTEGDYIRVRVAAKDRRAKGVRRGTKKRRESIKPVAHLELRAWLEEFVPKKSRLEDPDGPLFRNANGHTGWWTPTRMRVQWRKACEEADVPGISLYQGTKHTTGTALHEAGVQDRTIADFFGHADARSVVPYTKVRPQAVVRALGKLLNEKEK